MEKIKLYNKQMFELVPMGITTNIYNQTRQFSFISNLNYGEIESAFNNAENISKIEYLSVSNELLKTYIDCIGLKMLSKEFNKEYEDGKFADVYKVELEIN